MSTWRTGLVGDESGEWGQWVCENGGVNVQSRVGSFLTTILVLVVMVVMVMLLFLLVLLVLFVLFFPLLLLLLPLLLLLLLLPLLLFLFLPLLHLNALPNNDLLTHFLLTFLLLLNLLVAHLLQHGPHLLHRIAREMATILNKVDELRLLTRNVIHRHQLLKRSLQSRVGVL